MNCIEVKDVTKKYGNVHALEDVSVKFEANKIYGLLGRNGAGKSTLLNVITSRIFPDAGEVFVDGEKSTENDKALGKMFLMSEKTHYPETMRVKDAFKWSKSFYKEFDTEYAMQTAEKFGLNIKKKIKSLSTGYLSIFKLVVALSVNTPYVLLDEPVLGLDANHREMFYKMLLEKYIEKPFTAIISTHLIEEVSGIIENLVIVKDGRIIKDETTEELLSSGYTATGSAAKIDAYTVGKELISADTLGGIKSAFILGKPDSTIPDGIEITKLDLQKLFIQLTNS